MASEAARGFMSMIDRLNAEFQRDLDAVPTARNPAALLELLDRLTTNRRAARQTLDLLLMEQDAVLAALRTVAQDLAARWDPASSALLTQLAKRSAADHDDA